MFTAQYNTAKRGIATAKLPVRPSSVRNADAL